jgi:hypothetical protein
VRGLEQLEVYHCGVPKCVAWVNALLETSSYFNLCSASLRPLVSLRVIDPETDSPADPKGTPWRDGVSPGLLQQGLIALDQFFVLS